ncbi:MAG TPA: helix-turn-helix transcriptional regulator [Solirubrobacterales bacterium]|nr:helix-turn-helix transcriptional regulator [Solirubrobacterales bacterium]
MKMRPAAYVMLGMIGLGARSGYAIKKLADLSTRFFWPTSLAQVYPELGRLEEAGLLTRKSKLEGKRERFDYELTEVGEEKLVEWLRSPKEAETQFRDEGVLRLFLADRLPPDDQLALVRRLRKRVHEAGAHTREEIVPLAEALERGGTRFPAQVARLRADTYAYTEQWLERLESELEP